MITRDEILKNMEISFEYLGDMMESLDWESKDFYTEWLAQTYFYVSQTTPLVALACANTPTTRTKLHYRFIEELNEERGHEKLLERDLRHFGLEVSNFKEMPQTSLFYQSLHFQISQISPVTIVGFSLTLEGLAAKKLHNICARVEKAHGKEAASFLKLHCEVDAHHFEAAMPVLEMCENNELDRINDSIELCRHIYSSLLRGITERSTMEFKGNLKSQTTNSTDRASLN